MRRITLPLLCFLLIVMNTVSVAASSGRTGHSFVALQASSASYCAEPEELAFLKLINDYRAQNGLGPLVLTQTLGAASEHHSVDMAVNNYFAHILFDGTDWSQNMTNYGYTYNTYRGENLAAGNESASATFTQWKNSAGHNANMLTANYTAIGIGRAYGATSTYKWYWTTDFGGYTDAGAVVCPTGSTPTPLPTVAKTPASTPASSATALSQPTATRTPQPTATRTPVPAVGATSTAAPTSTKPPAPTATSTVTLAPTATSTNTPRPTATRTPLPTATKSPVPTSTSTVPPVPTATTASTATVAPAVVAYVANMSGKSTSGKGHRTVSVTANIVDSNGQAMPGATVTIVITAPNGATQTVAGITNRRGQMSWSAPVAESGMYQAQVNNVTMPRVTYDPSRNRINSVRIRVR
jgi:uncharacterized protein YkwD